MKLSLLAPALLAGCNYCQPAPSSAPVNAAQVYGELVEGGFLAPDEAGVEAVQQEHQRQDEPPWLACLFDGGTPEACGVPKE